MWGKDTQIKPLSKKGLVVGTILLFIGTTIIPSSAQYGNEHLSQPAIAGKTIYVNINNTQGPWDGTGEHPFQRIQDGVNHSQDGDTIFVFAGTYCEHVRINRTISLMGEDKYSTIIDADHTGVCVFLAAGRVNITGFTMQNSGTALYSDAGVGIKNMYSPDSNGNVITGNIMQFDYYGVFAYNSNSNIISNNIMRNNINDGLYFQDYDTNTTIINNTISDNGVNGIRIDGSSSDHIVVCANVIDNNSANGIILYSPYSAVTGNHISRSTSGVAVHGSYTSIKQNNITRTGAGLTLVLVMQCTVEENTFMNNIVDATFSYYLMQRVMLPFMLFPQITKWHANFWNQTLPGLKTINGKMDFSLFSDIGIRWMNWDFRPAQSPYPDIAKGG